MNSAKETLAIGDALKTIRQRRDMTQEDLSLESRFSINFISCVETGRKSVSLRAAEVFARALNVPVSFLLLLADSSKDQRVLDLRKAVLESLDKARSSKRKAARVVELV